MPIRIQWKDGVPTAECDTVAEAVEMMRTASLPNGSAPRPDPYTTNHESGKHSSAPDIVAFLNDQKPQVRSLLEHLYHLGEDTKAEDLAAVSGIDAKAYGGLLGALSKYASKANISKDDIYTTAVRFDGPRRERWYAPGKLLMEHGAKAFAAN
jgi:hypothetical protein